MKPIHDTLYRIRELINSALKQPELLSNKNNWRKLCSSLDHISDAQQAIDKYKSLDDFNTSDGYLFIYGLLHSVFLQQNTTKSLSLSLINQDVDFKKDYPKLYQIREVRNDSIGHPTDRRNDKYITSIVQHSIRKKGFEYMILDDTARRFEYVDIFQLLETQEALINKILLKVHDVIKNEIDSHKETFSDMNIYDTIPDTVNYHLEKLYEGCHSNSDHIEFTKIQIHTISELFANSLLEVEKRYKTLDALPGIEHQSKKVKFLLNKLEDLCDNNRFTEGYFAEALIDSLKLELHDYRKFLKNIDEEFKT
ncbi:MAG: hypothetical protein JJU37_05660 [Balneolaceae bacterium]|nr:hypothetical protein [Balneolaceae bacterium]